MTDILQRDHDKRDIQKSLLLLDLFRKTYCRYSDDYKRFGKATLRCKECPFYEKEFGCRVKKFVTQYSKED